MPLSLSLSGAERASSTASEDGDETSEKLPTLVSHKRVTGMVTGSMSELHYGCPRAAVLFSSSLKTHVRRKKEIS